MKKILTFIIILATLGVFLKCAPCAPCAPIGKRIVEKTIEKQIEKETGEKADIDIGESVNLPADFPRELIYPGAKVKGKFSIMGKGHTVIMETNASFYAVKRYYENLTNKGWKKIMEVEGAGEKDKGIMLTLKKEKEGFMVTITREKKSTMITIVYGKKR